MCKLVWQVSIPPPHPPPPDHFDIQHSLCFVAASKAKANDLQDCLCVVSTWTRNVKALGLQISPKAVALVWIKGKKLHEENACMQEAVVWERERERRGGKNVCATNVGVASNVGSKGNSLSYVHLCVGLHTWNFTPHVTCKGHRSAYCIRKIHLSTPRPSYFPSHSNCWFLPTWSAVLQHLQLSPSLAFSFAF